MSKRESSNGLYVAAANLQAIFLRSYDREWSASAHKIVYPWTRGETRFAKE
jgi:hypothetical protein